ncbi:hypothetical protein FNF27_06112 [Cafeteria roenbergensis]|uniref:THIF-type NAD/FAD binding fold domain-containing protein n=1 Tax=Cafeteria roenbergensis TaxID=33653 RepID=A0A5A8D1D0_CAFRO|nr:hypothetical protein FNF31_05501 [Cafeteria roenbergensis]KAA0172313.1 hypothetical protein FNF27_06112 [Cafeteria roenbergensis]
MAAASSMSEREAAVYDRAIRLWGAEAQARLMAAKLLVVGLSGLTAELCKNLVLSGLSLTLHDDAAATAEDLSANFFLSEDDIGKPRAAACLERVRELNPLVSVEVISGPLPAPADAGFWGKFTAVCTGGLGLEATLAAAAACRAHGALFFAGSQHGLVCTFGSDLGASHAFKLTDARAQAGGVGTAFKEAEGAAVSSVAFPPFAEVAAAPLASAASMLSRRRTRDPSAVSNDAAPAWVAAAAVERALSSKGLDRPPADRAAFAAALRETMAAELASAPGLLDGDAVLSVSRAFGLGVSPVCAVAGGQWGQEVIRAVTGRSPPLGNVFVFDARRHPQGQFGWIPAAPASASV